MSVCCEVPTDLDEIGESSASASSTSVIDVIRMEYDMELKIVQALELYEKLVREHHNGNHFEYKSVQTPFMT